MLVNLPGPGGSLGQCVFCGKNFAPEILMGESVPTIACGGIDARLPVHRKCLDDFGDLTDRPWTDLPDGPLRREFAEYHERNLPDAGSAPGLPDETPL